MTNADTNRREAALVASSTAPLGSVSACGMCPSCGYNLVRDTPVQIDGWTVHLDGLSHGLQHVHLPGRQGLIPHTLARAGGRTVPAEMLVERCDLSSTESLKALVYLIRKRVPGLPIQGIWRQGYRWLRATKSDADHAAWLRAQLAEIERRMAGASTSTLKP